ncbi:MAG: class I SAM-dependent methyltransferase [Pyrinomonadaceae bacterium]
MKKQTKGIVKSVSVERFYFDKEELNEIERQYAIEMHYMRYHFARQHIKGVVLDIACGCGYGTYMLTQKTPDVSNVIGVDIYQEAIDYANEHYKNDRNEFICSSIEDFYTDKQINFAVSIETIEHLEHPDQLVNLFKSLRIDEALITYPTRKTTHYNPYHKHDFTFQAIEKLFSPDYTIYDHYQYHREFIYIFLKRNT